MLGQGRQGDQPSRELGEIFTEETISDSTDFTQPISPPGSAERPSEGYSRTPARAKPMSKREPLFQIWTL